jgi:hypothetical protein
MADGRVDQIGEEFHFPMKIVDGWASTRFDEVFHFKTYITDGSWSGWPIWHGVMNRFSREWADDQWSGRQFGKNVVRVQRKTPIVDGRWSLDQRLIFHTI